MSLIIYFIVALFIGGLIPFQALVNAQLNIKIGHPIHAALISFTGGFLTFLLATMIFPISFPPLKKISTISPVLLTGGIIGSAFIFAAILVVPRIGPTAWVALIVAGQLISSILVDHYGLMGVNVNSINSYRIFGIVFLLIGVILITRK